MSGQLVEQWPLKKLNEICDVSRGKTITRKETVEGDVPVVAGGINSSYSHNTANRPANVITVSGSGANAGFVNFWATPIFASDCSTILPLDPNMLDVRFVYYAMLNLQDYISKELRRGAAQPHVYAKDLASLDIPVPSLEEQIRIVNILDNAFVNIKQSAIQIQTKLDDVGDLFQSVFSAITEDSSTWDNKTVEELLLSEKGSIRTGPFGSQLLHSEFVDEGIAVLGIDNAVNNEFRWGKRRFITEEKYSQLSRYTVKPGDVIITIMGTCGRCAIIPDDIPTAINTKHLCCITLDTNKCLPEYLHAYFLHHPLSLEYLNKMAKGSVMNGLNMGIIRKLPVLLPTISEQQNIIDKLNMVSNEIKKLEDSYQTELESLTELKQSILQEAFNGTL